MENLLSFVTKLTRNVSSPVKTGTSEEKAKAAAGVVPVIDSLARKTDMQELRSELKTDMSKLEVRLIMWMTSLHLATIALIVTLVKLL